MVHTRISLLSTTYFGPVQWYQKLHRSDTVWMEACETFQKQTFRNRCMIATPNGVQTLSVPVEHATLQQPLIKDLRISSHGNWRHQHWNALSSAYGESPFFDYYADDLHPFFEKEWTFLYDFNMEIVQKMAELLDIRPQIHETTVFRTERAAARNESQVPNSQCQPLEDYRTAIHPKHPQPDADFQPRPYYQVFRHKHGFLPNLSILDLLFNMGNEAVLYL